MLEFNISAKKSSQANAAQTEAAIPNTETIQSTVHVVASNAALEAYNKAIARREKVKKALEDGKKVYFRFLSLGTTWVDIPNTTWSCTWFNQWPTNQINEAQFKIEEEGILQ